MDDLSIMLCFVNSLEMYLKKNQDSIWSTAIKKEKWSAVLNSK